MNATNTETAADNAVDEYLRSINREWRVMVKDARFALYGGTDSPERRCAYIARRLGAIRRSLTQYLHRPDSLALAEALDATIFEIAA
jgi:hypothetical protein